MLAVHFTLLIFAYFVSGFFFANKLFQKNLLFFTSLIFGFIFLNGIFIISYIILKDTQLSFYIAVLFLLISLVYVTLNIKKIYKLIREKFSLNVLLMTFSAIALIVWPLFFIESKYYLHSGADDLIGDVYHQVMTLSNQDIYSFGVYIMHSVQYFAPTLSSLLLGKTTIANILLLDVMFLGLYFLSIYYFSNIYLNISKSHSLIIAFFTVCSNFYATTYINYHPGTLIAVPLMLFLITFVLKSNDLMNLETKLLKKTIVFMLIIVFVTFTYNIMILMFFLFPFLYIYIVKKFGDNFLYSKKNLAILTLLYVSACFVFYYYLLNHTSYLLFENPFTLEYPGYRQWELLRSEFLFAYYFGLIPSMLMGVGYQLFEYYNFWPIKYFIVLLSLVFMTISFYGIYYLSGKYEYIKYFTINILLFFIPFVILLDPYYTYKLLYITHGIFIISLYFGWVAITNKYKNVVMFLLITLGFINLAYLFVMNYNVVNRVSHNIKQYQELEKLDMEYQIGVANLDYKNIINYIHNINHINYKINPNSSNILISNFKQDITDKNNLEYGHIVYKGEFYTVLQLGKNYLLSTDKYKQVEQYNNMPLRWIYDDTGLNRSIISELNFIGSSNKKYLKFYAYPGESSMKGLDLDVTIDNIVHQFKINGETLVSVPLGKDGNFSVKISTTQKGVSMFPKEQRKLLVMLSRVSFSDESYTTNDFEELNPKNDVANQDFNKSNNILIGNGWYPQELANMRWGSDNVELLILNSELDRLDIEFDLEPGPSLKELPLKIDILTDNNEKIAYIEIDKREKIRITLPVKANERYQIIKLKVLNDTKKLKFDPRDLNFRLFSVKVLD